MRLYKFLNEDGSAIHGHGKWKLSRGSRPGGWMPKIVGDLVACRNGYHVVSRGGLLEWLGSACYEVEARGERIRKDSHVLVCREARLIRRLQWTARERRLFVCDCAERVLHIFEEQHSDDSRVRNCIEIARKVADGDLPISELDAARAAAWAAARAAARAAAGVAARAAAGVAAGAAAGNADGAAGAAVRAAAWAAWAAARAAETTWIARGAWAADAAAEAARVAERKWQTKRLLDYMEGRA